MSKEATKTGALDGIDEACLKIHGVAGLLGAGDTDEGLLLQKSDVIGISFILRDCARNIQEAADDLRDTK